MQIRNLLHVKTLFLLLSAVLFLSNCKKTPDSDSNETRPDLSTKITASLVSGFVTDENDAPVLNAAVVIGSKIVATDKYGYFEVGNVEVVKTAATVTINKTGYFKAIKTFAAEAGKGAFFRIKLMPKTIVGTISAAVGGTITLSNGLAIKFPAGAITDVTTNKPYTGDVRVAAKLISATDPDLNSIMPGDLRGVNSANNMRLLTTYGMAAVELSGPAGEFLQISDGKKAILYMPIPASLQAGAPSSIPLWYFDEGNGLWKEEGSASKLGNMYVGEVGHFSFWNCDVPNNYVQFNCTIVNQNGQPLQHVLVKVTNISTGASGFGYTDTAGYTGGAVPNNAQLRLEVFGSTACITPSYSQVFNTTNVNISLGTITISSATFLATVSGTVTNCTNLPVTNGNIVVQSGNTFTRYPISSAGTYSFSLLLCGNSNSSITVFAEDLVTQQQGTPASYTIIPGNNIIPNIQACGSSLQQFVVFTVNGTTRSHIAPHDSILHDIAVLVNPTPITCDDVLGFDFGQNIYTRIFYTKQNATAGSKQELQQFTSIWLAETVTIQNAPVWVNITEYGIVGAFISGNFTGSFLGTTSGTIYNITCSFRVRRRA